jgi:electron transfer flavoprotein alpha/beta subunit
LNIIVCIKQVPDTTDVKIDSQTNTLIRDGLRSIMNPFDAFAVEEGLRLRDEHGGRVVVITMGPPQARDVLEEAVAMGADDAVFLSHRDYAGGDTLATSYALSQAIKKIGKFDLIICGKQAIDGDTAQVGPGIAVHLRLPQVMFVSKVTELSGRNMTFERMTEYGYDIVKSPLPCLISTLKDMNVPRYPSFEGKLRAKRMSIPVWGPQDIGCDELKIGLSGSPTMVERIFAPPVKGGCEPLPSTKENIDSVAQWISESVGHLWT